MATPATTATTVAATTAAVATPATAVTFGVKSGTLSPAAVYALSLGRAYIVIDPSALQKLCERAPFSYEIRQAIPAFFSLSPPDSVAAAAVLLNKLLLVGADSSSVLITAATANGLAAGSLDLAAALTCDEAAVAAASAPVALAFAAMIDCCAAPLARVADAIVALSCEAAGAFYVPTSGGGFCTKDEADVAAAMKNLLVGSDLAGADGVASAASFAKVPTVHGIFRQTMRALHEKVWVDLNTPVKLWKRDAGETCVLKDEALMLLASETGEVEEDSLMQLARNLVRSVHSMCKLSLARVRFSMGSIAGAELLEKLYGVINLDDLKMLLDKVMTDSDVVSVTRGVYNYLLKFREVLALEAAVAMTVIEIDSSIVKPRPGVEIAAGNSGKPQASGDKPKSHIKSNTKTLGKGTSFRHWEDATDLKNAPSVNSAVVRDWAKLSLTEAVLEKSEGERKKKKTLGKGTSSVLMLLRDYLTHGNDISCLNSALIADWGIKLSLLFDPKNPELESFLKRVKEAIESSEVRRLPKIPKGTRDFGGEQMAIRQRALSIISGVFKMHGGVAIDTPVFELRETLMGKYGEESKLIYDLADQGGELCSLRYDLTVPFARYLAMNNLSALRRYQIGKVYRRDNPSKGRYREFYQCDFDIAGVYEPMEPDFEVIKVLTELLNKLDIGMYEIKLNHRKLLDGMLEICGVPPQNFRSVCSSIDKLDKLTFEQVKKELVEEKGVSNGTAEKIGNLVNTRGPALEVLLELRKEGSKFMENDGSVVALNELEILFKALEKANVINMISFDLSLARGLDYYTGVIFEAVFKGATQVGSIAAGGRYDNLVGSINSGKHVPAVGVSLGIERVFAIIEQQVKEQNQVIRATETEVLLSILGKDLTLAAELASELWSADIKAEFKLTTRVMKHIRYATQSGIRWMVLVGDSEMRDGKVKLKDIRARQEEEIPRRDFVQVLKQRLTKP